MTDITLLGDKRSVVKTYKPTIKDGLGKVCKIYDGDTFHITALLEVPVEPIKLTVRLSHIDTPELRSRDPVEKEHGYKSKEALSKLIPLGSLVKCSNVDVDKYGRTLCDVHTMEGINVNSWMLDNNYAKKYEGGHKDVWSFE